MRDKIAHPGGHQADDGPAVHMTVTVVGGSDARLLLITREQLACLLLLLALEDPEQAA